MAHHIIESKRAFGILDSDTILVQVHDRGDGTFMVFFVFNAMSEMVTISIQTKEGQIVSGKRVEHAWPEHEQCYCPAPDGQDFAAHYGCPAREKQLESDLIIFPVISKELLARARVALVDKNACFVHYIIRENRIWGKAYGPYQGFRQYIDEMLTSLARRVLLRENSPGVD